MQADRAETQPKVGKGNVLRQVKHRITNLEGLVHLQEHRFSDLRAVNQSSVAGAKIFEQKAAFLPGELAMTPRGLQVLDDNIAVRSTADHHRLPPLEGVENGRIRTHANGQGVRYFWLRLIFRHAAESKQF